MGRSPLLHAAQDKTRRAGQGSMMQQTRDITHTSCTHTPGLALILGRIRVYVTVHCPNISYDDAFQNETSPAVLGEHSSLPRAKPGE